MTAPPALIGRERWVHRALVVEALALLAMTGFAQRWIAIAHWSRIIGNVAPVPEAWRGDQIDALPMRGATVVEYRVGRAIRTAGRRLPWTPKCLAEAVSGQIMLRQLGTSGVVVIGLRPDRQTSTGRWGAHAWLLGRCGALTGGRDAPGFTAATVFELPKGIRAADVDLG